MTHGKLKYPEIRDFPRRVDTLAVSVKQLVYKCYFSSSPSVNSHERCPIIFPFSLSFFTPIFPPSILLVRRCGGLQSRDRFPRLQKKKFVSPKMVPTVFRLISSRRRSGGHITIATQNKLAVRCFVQSFRFVEKVSLYCTRLI